MERTFSAFKNLIERQSLTLEQLGFLPGASVAELDEIELLVHFDVASFWKAIQANDVAFNLLGSVTATITPNEATMSYDIEMINALSLESATRFDRNVEKDRIDGLIPNRERDASDTLELGGNLRCKWVWEEKLI